MHTIGPSHPPASRTGISGYWFYFLFALLPITYVRGFGSGYQEPKRMLLILIALSCLFALTKNVFVKKAPLIMNGYTWAMLALVLVRLTSLLPLKNIGFQLDSISANLGALLVGIYIINTDLDAKILGRVLLFPVGLVLTGVFLKILFGIAWFTQPYAVFVNLKNAVAVFLVAAVPFLLAGFSGPWQESATKKVRVRDTAILFFLLTLIFWAAFCYRTRSAWWMIVSYIAALGLVYLRTRQSGIRRLFLLTVASSVFALLLLLLVPTVMVWKSSTPYLDSLTTMTSLDNSSGRKEVWQVALHMIRSHPFRGVGTGAYPSQWIGYIPGSGVEPKVFALQVRVSPAFNDYLHVTSEVGVVPGLLFGWMILGLPLIYIWRLTRDKTRALGPEFLLCLGALALALDAMFDFAFSRPEAYILHAVCLNYASRTCGVFSYAQTRLRRSVAATVMSMFALLLLINFVLMGVGLSAKKVWAETKTQRSLEVALRYWPWDSAWSHIQLDAMLAAGRMDLATRYAEIFTLAWPNDAEGALISARLAEASHDYRRALAAYRRAVVKVAGGRCHEPGFAAYRALLARPEVQADPTLRLSNDEISACAK